MLLFSKKKGQTGEHPLQLVGILESARFLQLGDHASLGLIGCRHAVNETLRQFGRVERLEHVLVLDVFE